ncbi:MAG: DUF2795 domain-containing protein [Dietzia sp.]|nr:DUF2795 domain-containing protein [Dietzia sp.]
MEEPTTLHSYLSRVNYPATREELLRAAADGGAGADVLRHLGNIEDTTYRDPDEVSAAVTFLGETSSDYGHVTVYDQ